MTSSSTSWWRHDYVAFFILTFSFDLYRITVYCYRILWKYIHKKKKKKKNILRKDSNLMITPRIYLFIHGKSQPIWKAIYRIDTKRSLRRDCKSHAFRYIYWAKVLTDHPNNCDKCFVVQYLEMNFRTLNENTIWHQSCASAGIWRFACSLHIPPTLDQYMCIYWATAEVEAFGENPGSGPHDRCIRRITNRKTLSPLFS